MLQDNKLNLKILWNIVEGSRHEQDPMVFQFCREVRWGWGKTKPLGGWFLGTLIILISQCKEDANEYTWIRMIQRCLIYHLVSRLFEHDLAWMIILWCDHVGSPVTSKCIGVLVTGHLKIWTPLGSPTAIHLSPAPQKQTAGGVTASIVLTPSTQGWHLGWGDGTWGGTVDGRDPKQPPGMYETLNIMG